MTILAENKRELAEFDKPLSTAEACVFLNISRQTLYKLVKSNRLPGKKVADKYRFSKQEILRFFDHDN